MTTNAATKTPRSSGDWVGQWAVPALWLSLSFTLGPALAEALDPRSRPVQLVASTGLWLVWAAALGASLVPRTTSLTAVRIVMPASVVAAGWAAWVSIDASSFGASQAIGLAFAGAVTIVVLSSFTGDVYVNGSSYGDERRLPLRPPAGLLIGPIELAWIVCVVGFAAGPLLLAAQAWVLGGVLLAVGWPASWFSARALHGLSQRWVVFVPVGFVLHDLMALTDPILVPRRLVAALGPAPADTDAADYTLGSLGLALQVDLTEPIGVSPLPRRTRPGQRPALESVDVAAVLFAPTRPGAVLREARARRLPVR